MPAWPSVFSPLPYLPLCAADILFPGSCSLSRTLTAWTDASVSSKGIDLIFHSMMLTVVDLPALPDQEAACFFWDIQTWQTLLQNVESAVDVIVNRCDDDPSKHWLQKRAAAEVVSTVGEGFKLQITLVFCSILWYLIDEVCLPVMIWVSCELLVKLNQVLFIYFNMVVYIYIFFQSWAFYRLANISCGFSDYI